MDNPYLPPESPSRTGPEATSPASPPEPPRFDQPSSAFLTAIIALVGACAAQVASLVTMLLVGQSQIPTTSHGLLWTWLGFSGVAVCCGLHGGYRSLRRGSVASPTLPAFLGLYSLTARVDNLQFGWPFQLHMGMVLGHVGIGLNFVGVGMILWWIWLKGRETARAG
jgi:hypothetical protein